MVDAGYKSPTREEIAARLAAKENARLIMNGPEPEARRGPGGGRAPVTNTEKQTGRNFVNRVRIELKAQKRSVRWLADATAIEYSTLASMLARSAAVHLGRAAAIASALGLSLDSMLTPWDCPTCHGKPPAGFACKTCGTES